MAQVELSWYEEVWQQGYAEGYAKGYAEGFANSLITSLERRFGHLSDENIQRIRNANISQLKNWRDLVHDKICLADILKPENKRD